MDRRKVTISITPVTPPLWLGSGLQPRAAPCWLVDTERKAFFSLHLLLTAKESRASLIHSYRLTVISYENVESSAQYYFTGWKTAHSAIYLKMGSYCFSPAHCRGNKYSQLQIALNIKHMIWVGSFSGGVCVCVLFVYLVSTVYPRQL